ncbi:unnamed protein product [Brassica napus]|nr:unnamed protein product [Brassica napus]
MDGGHGSRNPLRCSGKSQASMSRARVCAAKPRRKPGRKTGSREASGNSRKKLSFLFNSLPTLESSSAGE